MARKKSDDDLNLTATMGFDLLSEIDGNFSLAQQERDIIAYDFCKPFLMMVHTFYNIIYDERYELMSKLFYCNEEQSKCLIRYKDMSHIENMSKKMYEYAVMVAYGMVKSDLEKEKQHQEQVEEWKDELEELERKINNTRRSATDALHMQARIDRFMRKKKRLQKKINTPYSSKRTFGSKSMRHRIDSIVHRALNTKKNNLTREAYKEEKKKNKHVKWEDVRKRFSDVKLTLDEMREVMTEKEKLIKEFYQTKYGQFISYGDAAEYGNRFFKFKTDKYGNLIILFCPNKKTHIEMRLKDTEGYGEIVKKLYEKAKQKKIALTFTLDIFKNKIHIAYDPITLYGREEWEKIKPKKRRVASIDLNPNEVGFVITDFYGKCGFRILHAEVFSIKEINDAEDKLDGNGVPSSSSKRIYLTNKRHYEIDIICKDMISVAKHYHCETFAMEDLKFSTTRYNTKPTQFNKLVNKYWCRTRFVSNIKRECALARIEVKEIRAAYSSFVGNFLFRSINLPDMCLAALEIGRRAFRLNEVYKLNNKTVTDKQKEAIMLPDAEDFKKFVTKSLNEFRNELLSKKFDAYKELELDSRHLLKKVYDAIGTKMVKVQLDSLLQGENDSRIHRTHSIKSKTQRIIFIQ